MNAVAIESLRKQFGAQQVLPAFDLEIAQGEFVVLLGPSGCGKTTVLRCLAGLEKPDAGRILIDGKVVEDAAGRISVPIQKRDLGFVFQHYALWPHMSVSDNIAYPLRMRGARRDAIAPRVDEMLSLAGLEGLAARYPAELSGGQQQRVALARALVASPQVLLLDEPLSNLDAQRRVTLRRHLRALHRQFRTTTVYVTHDQVEALTMADRVIVMNQGRIEQAGSPQEVFERPATRFVAEFLGYENILPGRVLSTTGRIAAVDIEGLGEIQIETPARPAPGTVVSLAFRAANTQLHQDGAVNSLSATVRDATYLGDSCEYELDVNGARLISRLAGPPLPAGSSLRVCLNPAAIVLLPEAAENIVTFRSAYSPARLSA